MRPMMAMQPAPRLQIFPRGEGQGCEVIYQLMSVVPDCLLSQACGVNPYRWTTSIPFL